jgi:hypothetical protein
MKTELTNDPTSALMMMEYQVVISWKIKFF